jgi:flagellin
MALNSINTNIAAYSAQGNIGKASNSASASIARLSSGNRITKASDDVAALSIGTSLRTGVTTLKTALLNASQGTSLLSVADGALSQISEILQRQKAIATQAGSGTLGSTERGFLNQEFQNLTLEIDRIASTTNFNGVTLLNGGLGNKTQLAQYDATAAFMAANTNGGVSADSDFAIQAFSLDDGGSLAGATAGTVTAAGEAALVDSNDSATAAALTNSAYNAVNSAVSGKFTSFKYSNVVYGATTAGSATLTATIGGVNFTGTVKGTDTTAIISNGSTYIQIAFTAADFASDAAANIGEQQMYEDFKDTSFMRTSVVQGVNFADTALEGVVGANAGIAMARLSDGSKADISDFRYVQNTGTDSTLAVTVNGKTFTATGVADTIAAGDIIVFDDGQGQALQIDLTGLTTDIADIRTVMTDRTAFLNALNAGFSRAGSGLNFQVGSTSSDSLRVSLASSSTVNLFNAQNLDVSTATGAANAVTALDTAIAKVTSLRADVGAAQSRFNFASANLETSIQNQDAARGVLLDTDVAGESTAYATAQVQLQAGIAVLAQANQLPQNLLKLIS